MKNIFKIHKEERQPLFLAFLLFFALNALMVFYHHEQFMRGGKLGFWTIFSRDFEISGFDFYTYLTLSKWDGYYTEFRHPLLQFLWYPFYLINHWQMGITEKNLSTVIVAIIMVILSCYSFIFMHRIFREVMGLCQIDSNLLSTLFFSFGYIMVSVFAPDHFGISLFFLTMALYIAGCQLNKQEEMPVWQCALLFLFTAGVTLSNGVKIFLCALFTKGKRLFSIKYLLLGCIIPTLAISILAIWQNETYIKPHKEAGARIAAQRSAKDSVFKAQMAANQQHWKQINGKQIKKEGVWAWANLSVSRPHSLVENWFGESLILHRDHLLQDIGQHRPIFVPYNSPLQYILEAVIVILFGLGLWTGRHSKFLWMVASCVAFDTVIHFGLGFGLNEVYIMTAHWTFIIPIAIGYLLKIQQQKILYQKGESLKKSFKYQSLLRMTLMMISVFLLSYNGILIFQHLYNY